MLFAEECVRYLTKEELRVERIVERSLRKMMPQIEEMMERKLSEWKKHNEHYQF